MHFLQFQYVEQYSQIPKLTLSVWDEVNVRHHPAWNDVCKRSPTTALVVINKQGRIVNDM